MSNYGIKMALFFTNNANAITENLDPYPLVIIKTLPPTLALYLAIYNTSDTIVIYPTTIYYMAFNGKAGLRFH